MQTDAVAHAGTGCLHGLVREVRISCGRLHLRVTEQLADHREAFAKGQRTRRRGMSEVVNSYLLEPGPLADAPPRPLQIGEMQAGEPRLPRCAR